MTSLVELGYGAGWSVIKALPRSVMWPVFRAGADRAAAKNGPGTQRLRRNLRQVVGPELAEAELDVLVRDGLRSYARYWLDAFQLPRYSVAQLKAMFRMEHGDRIRDALELGKGCVIALPHMGNWDFAGAWVCAHGWPITTVAERLRPEGLYRKFVAYRESLGMQIVPATGAERNPLDILTDALRQNRVVPLVADRDLSARGVEVRFFGGRTRMPAGPAMLALRSGAPLLTVSLWYDAQGTPCGRVDGPLEPPTEGTLDQRVRLLTQQVATGFERGIAEHPQDWHMLQKLWLADGPAGDAPNVPAPSGEADPAAAGPAPAQG